MPTNSLPTVISSLRSCRRPVLLPDRTDSTGAGTAARVTMPLLLFVEPLAFGEHLCRKHTRTNAWVNKTKGWKCTTAGAPSTKTRKVNWQAGL